MVLQIVVLIVFGVQVIRYGFVTAIMIVFVMILMNIIVVSLIVFAILES